MRMKTNSLRMLRCLFAALISTAVAAHAEMNPGSAVVRTVTGSASYLDELGFNHPLTVGTVLKEGHTIKTGVDSSVDLFLDQNGSDVGLDAGSILRFEKLAYEKTALGTKIDTRLDLKAGQLSGHVNKLIAGSRYEVKMPHGVATVRGTTFFIDAQQGTVHVTSGNVTVTVSLTVGAETFTKTVQVHAGESLFIPKTATSGQDFENHLVAVSTPPGVKFNKLTRYDRVGTGKVAETFTGMTNRTGTIKIKKPPASIVVSP